MDIKNVPKGFSVPQGLSVPRIPDLTAPQREIELSQEDVTIVSDSIDRLKKSRINKEELFEIFDDWQTKRTLTAKRVLVSTSIIVTAASWIGIDYADLSFFGLKIANGNPERFIIFVLVAVLVSGLFYEASRRIDLSVRKAKIANLSHDLSSLEQPVADIDLVMDHNNISSFRELYFDFESSFHGVNQQHHAIHAFDALHFYQKHLKGTNRGHDILSFTEMTIVYMIALCAIIVLVYAIV